MGKKQLPVNFDWDNFVSTPHTHVVEDLDCDNFDEINYDLIKYIHNHMSFLLSNDPNSYRYDNHISDMVHFAKNNPKLIEFIAGLGLTIRDAYFSLAWETAVYQDDIEQRDVIIEPHVDCPPVHWKINWPVMNMQDSSLRFFELSDPVVKLNDIMNGFRVPYKYLRPVKELVYNPKKCFFMKGSTIHDAVLNKPIEWPRIGLFIMFFQEPKISIV